LNDSKAKRSWTPSALETRVHKRAERLAEEASRLVPWPELLKVQRQYVRWNAFELWIRAIEETEGSLPHKYAEIVDQRAPGFLRFAAEFDFHHPRAPHPKAFWRMLARWVEERIFRKPSEEGWMFAVGFYAVRQLATLRDEAYFEWGIETWKQSKPRPYPSFEQWRSASVEVSGDVLDQVEMRDDRRELIKLCHGIRPRALELAIDRYVDWSVFAYWARPALEEPGPLCTIVETEVEKRYPGFLGLPRVAPTGRRLSQELVRWIEEHEFSAAKEQGWLEVLRYHARLHPRNLCARRFCRHWTIERKSHGRWDYPSFEEWSRQLETNT